MTTAAGLMISGCNDGNKTANAASEEQRIKDEQEKFKEKKKIIDGVMAFFESEKFFAKEETKERGSYGPEECFEKYVYDNFKLEEHGILTFNKLNQLDTGTQVGDKSVGFAVAYLCSVKLKLLSCKPTISIRDHSGSIVKKNPYNLKDIVVKGLVAEKSLEKRDSETGGIMAGSARKIAVMMTDEDLEKLKSKDFPEFKETEVVFSVTSDLAPRLKAALEDLLKAHNVEVSKY